MTNIGVTSHWWMTGEKASDWLNRCVAGCSSGSGNDGGIEDPSENHLKDLFDFPSFLDFSLMFNFSLTPNQPLEKECSLLDLSF